MSTSTFSRSNPHAAVNPGYMQDRTRKRPRHAALRSRRRPPRYPSRLHNAWTASSRSTRPAVHARFDPWSCLQGCGRAADATRLHAAHHSAATKGCPDQRHSLGQPPQRRARRSDALVTRRAARRRRGRLATMNIEPMPAETVRAGREVGKGAGELYATRTPYCSARIHLFKRVWRRSTALPSSTGS